MRDYKKYEVWVKSHELVLMIYKEVIPSIPDSEKYGLCSQLRRAAYSIPMNIAEGCGRTSDTEFCRFLTISLGSANETEYCLILLNDLRYIDKGLFEKANALLIEIKYKLINLIKAIRKTNAKA